MGLAAAERLPRRSGRKFWALQGLMEHQAGHAQLLNNESFQHVLAIAAVELAVAGPMEAPGRGDGAHG